MPLRNAISRLAGSAVCATAVACASEPAYVGEGTAQMAQRLQRVATEIVPERDIYANAARIDHLERRPEAPDLRGRLLHRQSYARELMRGGRFADAQAEFLAVLEEADAHREDVPPEFVLAVRELLATSYLKQAEQEGCVGTFASERCAVPIGPAGVHPDGEALQAAIREYEAVLTERGTAPGMQWLLNVAFMMHGTYPDGVPAVWRVAPETLAPEFDIGEFPNRAPELGLDVAGLAGGVVMDDLSGDGLLDIMVSSRGVGDQMRFFENAGDGTWRDRTADAGLTGLVGGINLVQADYNNDGWLDVFVLRGGWLAVGHPNSLLRNNGDGTFDDVTEAAGLLEPMHPTQTAAWGDFDHDGWLDLYIGNETRPDERSRPSQLFRNNRDGTFTDIARRSGVGVIGFVKAVAWGDVDNDGWLDLYVSRLGEPNVLFRNLGREVNGSWGFEDVTDRAGVAEPLESFPAWFWDFDNDGWLDLFVAGRLASLDDIASEYLGLPHQAELPRLYRNRGDGTFADVTTAARADRIMFAMGSNFGDLDNDGYLDLYAGTGDPDIRAIVPNRMFRNDGGVRLQEVTGTGFGHVQKGHGVAFGDLDHDGDQDVYHVLGGAFEGDRGRNVLWENPGHGHRWITLVLEGVETNRAALGVRVAVSVTDTSGADRTLHRVVGSGASFGASSLQVEVGLGSAAALHAVELAWPTSGRIDRFDGLELDRVYFVREGAEPVELERARLPLSR
jgi:hypothetical protein